MKNVLVILPLNEEQKARLEGLAADCVFTYTSDAAVTEEQIQNANIILGNPAPGKIHGSEKLEFLQLAASGADGYVKPGVLKPGTKLCSSTGAYGQAVSEHAFALTLSLVKKLYLYRDDQNAAVWGDRGSVGSLRGATVAVVGLGDIGLQYARLVHAVGAYVIGLKRRSSACPEGVDELCLTDELDQVLPRADVVCSFLPGTASTYHLFNDERFSLMKPSAFFVNCGRGTAIDNEALCRALQNGVIAAAAADVMEIEPLPAESPLWRQPNMVITPHISGGFHLPATLENIVEISFGNFAASAPATRNKRCGCRRSRALRERLISVEGTRPRLTRARIVVR